MPAVIPTATVLVTGSSGFSGIWITRALLEAGYRVHGTVRSTSKGVYLQELFKTHGDRFKPIVVEDTSKVMYLTSFVGSRTRIFIIAWCI